MEVEGQEELENQKDILIKQETILVDCENSQSWVCAPGSGLDEEPLLSNFVEAEAQDPLEFIDPLIDKEATTPTSTDGENENLSGSQGCSCHSIHFKQNELLRKKVHDLSVRNTLLKDFIQLEYGEKFKKFVKKRELQDKGKTGKEISGKRSRESDKQSKKESEKSKKSGRNHHHLSKTTVTSSTFHKENITASSSSSSAPVQAVKKELPTSPIQFKKIQETKKIEIPKPQPIYPQHKVSEIANYVANPLTDNSLMITKDNPPPHSIPTPLHFPKLFQRQ